MPRRAAPLPSWSLFLVALVAPSLPASSGNFYETHIDLTENVLVLGWLRWESLLGYRFYRYDEGLRIRQNIVNSPNFVAGHDFCLKTILRPQRVHGGDFGFRTLLSWNDFSLNLLSKLAVGHVSRDINISGGKWLRCQGSTCV